MKKLVSSILGTIILISSIFFAIPVNAVATDSMNTTGTAISSAEEFKSMAKGKEFYLTQDIDFGGAEFSDFIIERWNGTIHGNGFALKNFSIKTTASTTSYNGKGVIGRADGNISIDSLRIGTSQQHVQISAINNDTDMRCGTLIGRAVEADSNTVTLSKITVYADITATNIANELHLGGIVGYLNAKSNTSFSISECKTYGSITVQDTVSNKDILVGGIIGSNMNWKTDYTLNNCENNMNILAETDNQTATTSFYSKSACSVGGIVGYTKQKIEINDCKNHGKINISASESSTCHEKTYAGGIIGLAQADGATVISNCKNYGAVSCPTFSAAIVGGANSTTNFVVTNCVNYGSYSTNFATGTSALQLAHNPGFVLDDTAVVDKVIGYIGYQYNTQNNTIVRFVAGVNSINWQNVGFKVTVTDGDAELYSDSNTTNIVYSGYIDGENERKAEEDGFDHIYMCVLKNLPTTCTVTVETFGTHNDGEMVSGRGATLMFENGQLKSHSFVEQ